MASSVKFQHVKSIETWTPRQPGQPSFTKVAVRVAKGKVGPQGQRPGTFQGATNFRQK
jgi:hypothetical protein